MKPFLLQPATDWTNQTYLERLILCDQTLHVHGLIGCADYHRTLNRIEARADLQREQLVKAVMS